MTVIKRLNKRTLKEVSRAFGFIAGMLFMSSPAYILAQSAQVSQSILPTARITNQDDILKLLDLLFIFEEEVTSMDIIDVTSNGFGPDDIVVTYPSQQTHYLGADVDGEAQAMMDEWAFEAEFRRDASSQVAPEQFDPALNPTLAEGEQAEMAILSEILYSLQRNYKDEPVRMLFERDNGAFTFQMWDFKPPQMQHVAKPSGPPDTLTTFDLLYVLASDSLIEADTAYYDILYLQRTVRDSVFIPVNEDDDLSSNREFLSPGDALRRQRRLGPDAGNR
ncbi:MAG: hypothetical protein KTR29_11230 [Rhodothermaceae bacterium]|nr:hypothetical protein [Rhodothermaceae bacterium]